MSLLADISGREPAPEGGTAQTAGMSSGCNVRHGWGETVCPLGPAVRL